MSTALLEAPASIERRKSLAEKVDELLDGKPNKWRYIEAKEEDGRRKGVPLYGDRHPSLGLASGESPYISAFVELERNAEDDRGGSFALLIPEQGRIKRPASSRSMANMDESEEYEALRVHIPSDPDATITEMQGWRDGEWIDVPGLSTEKIDTFQQMRSCSCLYAMRHWLLQMPT